MSEWWAVWSSYRPSDFLLFSSRTYYRLFELYNADIWPLQIGTMAAGIAMIVLARSRIAWRGRLIAALLAACWLWIAWAFHWQRYATINWAANYFAVGFAIEAVLLIWIGTVRDELRIEATSSARTRIGIAIFSFAVLMQPMIGLMLRRSWPQLEVFGVTPDPTVVGTLGMLLAAHRIPWLALPIPLLWCVVSGTTLSVMNAADALLLPAVAVLVLLLALRKQRLA